MNLNHPILTACVSSALLAAGLASSAQAQTVRRPSAPSALAASAGQDGRVTLNWRDNSSNETAFKVTRTPAFPNGDISVGANSTTFIDTPGNGRFRYRVSAVNSAGPSRWTSAAAATVNQAATNQPPPGPGTDQTVSGSGQVLLGAPAAPSNLAATPGANQITLTWRDNSDNELYFEIQKQTQNGATWIDNDSLQEWTNHTSHVDAVGNGTYRYRVRAGQWGGISAFTAWTQVTIGGSSGPTIPNAPSGLQGSDAGSGRAMVSWTDNSNNETSFLLERNPAFAGGTMTLNSNVTSLIDQTGNGTFSYRVSAANSAGISPATGWTQVIVTSGSTGGGGGGSGGGGGGGSGGSSPGWTDLTPPAGSQVFYVSSSSGADTNPGTQAAPFRSLARGYQALRDGQPDQMLLKCGDTWNEAFPTFNKGANSDTTYMVFGSYSTGARPKLRTGSSAIYGGTAGKHGVAIVGLDFAPSAAGSNFAGLSFFQPWANILIEDCAIIGYPVNIVLQEVGPGRINNVKIRRCIIADSTEMGSGHSQGLFMGSVDNWVVEGCVMDNNARRQADMFCHNVYIHQSAGPGIFKDNISSRSCSHGVQQRPGGNMENNLYLQNPINAYQGTCDPSYGGVPAPTNYFRYNVAIDSRDINGIDKRGFGYVIGGAPNTVIEYNVAAHQQSGTEAVTAFDLDGIDAATVRGNVVYDWTYNGMGWGTAYQWETGGNGAVLFENNKAYQPNHGMCVRHDGRTLNSSFTYRNNSYWSTNPATGYEQFSRTQGVGGSWSWWAAQAGESGTTFSQGPVINVKIDTYMASIGMSGGIDAYVAQARLQSKQNWRPQFSADGTNDWVRTQLGMSANP